MIVFGDFNGDIRNSPGEKHKKELNHQDLKLTEFASFFNLCPVNLLKSCIGPLTTVTVRDPIQFLITFSCPIVCLIIS